ncbi:ABC-F family ATP-binding cassette domain-containing protein [Alloscardovia omnicolens]|uniref:ABC-F family ATP-binding cassette domain-containing protein n=1 Tax=Alloscardovia omnicolens TaxID=419015 RepID=UPI00254C5C01|nr:ABC-F family ATP-binding cassette domain-containing protein [Alloscardovia omnicolens]MDK6445349.1 ABC-F family ATP-binding cassette domain-containing protein [Alloscardovia omnicolens]
MPVHDIGLENVSLDFATKTIFRDVTLGVVEGDRIGIVGKNGDGKSTLLRILAGLQPVDSGRVTKRGGLSLGVLNQRDSLDDNATVVQAALEGREEYEWAADASSRAIVETLLLDIPLDTLVGTLSGGQRRRVDLARLLLHDWDILVLDEPTNHLDMPTIHWLAAHLKSRWSANAGALLVVTHDRWFLDEVCTRMWEVHDGIIDPFEGGYSAYMMQRVERERQADVAETKRRNLARKELAWLTRGARARSTKQKFHVKTAQELIADVPEPRNVVELKAMATSRLGKQVVDLIDVTQVYEQREAEQTPQSVSVDITQDSESGAAVTRTVTGKRILDNVTWLIGPGDRFGIVGANGVGKSTLLKIIDGSLVPTAGHVNIGKTVKFAVLSQRLDELEKLGKYRVKEVLSRYKPSYIVDGKETTPGQLMERLGFSAAQLMTPIADLSGGQKRRMQLLLILLDEPNVLIMDEPGNDLDTDMLTVMEDLLDTWPGTLIVVSHDAYLLERVTDHQFAIFDGKIRHLPGGVDDYFALLEGKEIVDNPISGGIVSTGNESVLTSAGVQTQSSHTADDKAARIAKREASKRMSAIERKIAKLQDEQKQLEEQMAAHNPSDFVGLNEINMQVEAVRSHIGELEMEWLEKSEIVEG